MKRDCVKLILRFCVPALAAVAFCVGAGSDGVKAGQNEKDKATAGVAATPAPQTPQSMSRIRPRPSDDSRRRADVVWQPAATGERRVLDFPGHRVTIDPIIPIYPNPTTSQTELTVAVHPLNPDVLIVGSNSASEDLLVGSQGWYYSSDAGQNWTGSDTLPLHTDLSRFMTDPAVSIDLDGNLFFNSIIFGGGADLLILRSTDQGVHWAQSAVPNISSGEDKNHLTIDVNRLSPFVHNVYTAYTDFGLQTPAIMFSRSTNRGMTFSPPYPVSEGLGAAFSQGVNLEVGPSGELYAAWSGYQEFPPDSTMLGFTRSMDGGLSFESPRLLRWVLDLRGFLTKGSNRIRLNSYPVVSADRSPGPRHGWIYIVYAEKSTRGPDVFLLRSEDGGMTWSDPLRVNQDSTTHDQWLPWLSVDPVTGGIFVIYYDSRRFQNNDSAEVYVSSSWDGGESFVDVRVSAEPFLPVPIPGLAEGYIGDYLGISALGGIVWPVWNDDHTGIHQAYTSRMEVVNVGAAPALKVSPDTLDFGEVFAGYPETRIATLRNSGFPDTLQIDSIQSSHLEFQAALAPVRLGGGVTTSMSVLFDPSSATSHAAVLSIFTSDSSQPRFDYVMRGLGVDPPGLEYAPDSLVFDLSHGELDTMFLRVENRGAGPLTFQAKVDLLIGVSTGNQTDSLWSLVLEDIAGDGQVVDVVSLRARVIKDSVKLQIEFSGPIDINNFGGFVSFDVDRDSSTGVSPSFGTDGQDIGAEFELSFFDLPAGVASLLDAASQAELDRLPAALSGAFIEITIPLQAIASDDGIIDVTSVFGTQTAPTDWMPAAGHGTIPGVQWVRIEPAEGGVPSQDTGNVSVTVDATILTGGRYRALILLESNDPARSEVAIPVVLNVTGIPRIEFAADTIFLPEVYVGFATQAELLIRNPGTDLLAVSSIVAQDAWIDFSFQPFVLDAGRDTMLIIEVTPVTAGVLHTELYVTSNDPVRPQATLFVNAASRLAPGLAIVPDSLSFRIRLGDSAAQLITLRNFGPGMLEWNIVAADTGTAVRQSRWGMPDLDATIAVGASAHLLTAVPPDGTLGAGDSARVTIGLHAGGLEDGRYVLSLVVVSNDPRAFFRTVPVELEVVGLRPGDPNGDFQVDSRDLIYLVNFIFREGPGPVPGTGDPNCDSAVTILDIFLLIEHVFQGGPEPVCL